MRASDAAKDSLIAFLLCTWLKENPKAEGKLEDVKALYQLGLLYIAAVVALNVVTSRAIAIVAFVAIVYY